MYRPGSDTHEPPYQPLQGRLAWIISDGKAGHEAQCLGVAEALGVRADVKRVTPKGLCRFLAPWGPVSWSEKFAAPGTAFAPPWPAIALATGRLTTPYIRALKRMAGEKTFTVILLDSRTSPGSADLFWVPEHDTRRGNNVITTLTSPHRFSAQKLSELRRIIPAAIAALPHPRVAVFIGGPNGDYKFDASDASRFSAALAGLSSQGASLMITPSRRTPAAFLAAVEAATARAPRIIFNGQGPNPYAGFLAHADAFVVTADSVNMAGEAAATGKPIYIFSTRGGSAKFDRFHAALRATSITRPLPDPGGQLQDWTYEPLDSALVIAGEIGRRWALRHGKV
jgi:uncharacterized protein